MGIILLKFGKPSPLPSEERVLYERSTFRAVSSTTCPSYRIGFSLPPLMRVALLVTNRRCVVWSDLFCFITQEIGMWYPGQNPADDPETITSVRCATGLFGRCLEIRSRNPKRRQRWLWSPNLTLRFFFEDPEEVESMIKKAMGNEGANKSLQATRDGVLPRRNFSSQPRFNELRKRRTHFWP
jgi:hypothetical protein